MLVDIVSNRLFVYLGKLEFSTGSGAQRRASRSSVESFSIKHSPQRQHFNGARRDVYGRCVASGVGRSQRTHNTTIQFQDIDQIAWKLPLQYIP